MYLLRIPITVTVFARLLTRFVLFGSFKTDAGDAAALYALYVKEKAVVFDDFAGFEYVTGFCHQEACDGRVGFGFGKLQVEATIKVTYGQASVEHVGAV